MQFMRTGGMITNVWRDIKVTYSGTAACMCHVFIVTEYTRTASTGFTAVAGCVAVSWLTLVAVTT